VAEPTQFKYRAFLSYSHRDKAWAKWLHSALEGYRVDKDLAGRQTAVGPVPKTLRPIFRDRDDFSAGPSLTEQTIAALEASNSLIVICSPSSAQSPYVNEEIRRFKATGRARRVIPVIVDGEPGDPVKECYPPALRHKLGCEGQITDDQEEPIAADAREQGDGKEIAKQKVIAGILGLGLDEIVCRSVRAQKRQSRLRISIVLILFGLLIASVGGFSWVRYELSRNESLLDRTLQRATNLINKATGLSDQFGVPRAVSLSFLEEADNLFKDMAELGRDTPALRFRKVSMLVAFARNYQVLGHTHRWRQRATEAHYLMRTLVVSNQDDLTWQNELSRTYETLGDLLMAEGRLNETLETYRAGLVICERLVAADSSNANWRRNLSLLQGRIGDALMQQGNRSEALIAYFAAERITINYLGENPGSEDWLRDFSVLEDRLGHLLATEGRLDEALEKFSAVIAFSQASSDSDPKNTLWLRDLSMAHSRVGDVLNVQGKLEEALASFRAGLAIAQRLVGTDIHNVVWRRDVSQIHSRIGNVLGALGHLDVSKASFIGGIERETSEADQEKFSEALQHLRTSLAIQQHFVDADASNKEWQADMGISYGSIGDLLVAQKKFTEAMRSYRDSVAVWELLAAHDPSNINWQANLEGALNNTAVMLAREGKFSEALPILQSSSAIAVRIAEADPENVEWKIRVVVSNLYLAGYDADPIPRLESIVSELRKLKQQDKLSPVRVPWLVAIEKTLVGLRSRGSIDKEKIFERLRPQ
jgi:tetratricopeptide (TPR) repeat protein